MRTLDPATLDPGIRDVVVALRAAGFGTVHSGDDAHDGSGPFPHVAIVETSMIAGVVRGTSANILRVVKAADPRDGWIVEAGYSTADGVLTFVASLPGVDGFGHYVDAVELARTATRMREPFDGADLADLARVGGRAAPVNILDDEARAMLSESERHLARLREVGQVAVRAFHLEPEPFLARLREMNGRVFDGRDADARERLDANIKLRIAAEERARDVTAWAIADRAVLRSLVEWDDVGDEVPIGPIVAAAREAVKVKAVGAAANDAHADRLFAEGERDAARDELAVANGHLFAANSAHLEAEKELTAAIAGRSFAEGILRDCSSALGRDPNVVAFPAIPRMITKARADAAAEGIETARRLGQAVDATTARLDEAVSILRALIAAEDAAVLSGRRGFGMYVDAMTRARELMAPLARSTEAPTLAKLRGEMFEGVVKALVEWASVRGFIDADDALLAPVVALAQRAVKASNGDDGIEPAKTSAFADHVAAVKP